MRGSPEGVVELVRERNDIAEVVGRYVVLKPAGQNLKGLCPFHKEKTPSFVVSPSKQVYHCFGCGAGGDVFSFMMRLEGMSFPEALRMLAERAGVDVDQCEGPQAAAARREKDQIYAVNRAAADYFRATLVSSPEGAPARRYLGSRGIGRRLVDRFELGFAAAGGGLLTHLAGKGFDASAATRAGLLVRTEGGGYRERFRDRVMFPILDEQGRVVGFGGRSLDGSEPKYLNSAETAAFIKGNNLYGIHLAKEPARRAGEVVIVEGYTDVIAAHGAGFENVVASLGTALTPAQARLAGRYAKQIVIAYDADTAGTQATVRGLEVVVGLGFRVRVAMLPEGQDPDSLLRGTDPGQGAEAFRRALNGARGFVEYRLDLAARRWDLRQVEGRLGAVREIVPVLAGLGGPVEVAEYSRVAAARLGVDEAALVEEVERHRAAGRGQQRPRGPQGGSDKFAENNHTSDKGVVYRRSAEFKAERQLLALMLEYAWVLERVRAELGPQGFVDPIHRQIAEAALAGQGSDLESGPGSVGVAGKLPRPSNEEAVRALSEIALAAEEMTAGSGEGANPAAGGGTRAGTPASVGAGEAGPGIDVERAVCDCIARLKAAPLRAKVGELLAGLRRAEAEGDWEGAKGIAAEIQELKERLRVIASGAERREGVS